ncbi:MAG: hypothetical protein KIC66_11770 [Clostridium sp.]|uniref:hypothetical protein n=1 Tax=Clostridium sp. TaxID=1506 RepID=UPI0025C0252E|nr:hypothetical protein [Clostridium sp.]MBS5927743.1 hypothetical protein [Clostridium sp.]
MSNKVELIYENGQYKVMFDGKELSSSKDSEESFEKFKQVIKDNVVVNANSWESIETALRMHNLEGLEINSEYKAATYGELKFFYNSGKVFYTPNDKMIQLIGGFYLFNFVISMVESGHIKDYKNLLDFCVNVLEKRATYRVNESNLIVSSAAFNYGSCEYNFFGNRILKGASIVSGTFDDFKKYVYSIIK